MRKIWQVFHHVVAHPLVGLSNGRLWAWKFHDWTAKQAWGETEENPVHWAGLE